MMETVVVPKRMIELADTRTALMKSWSMCIPMA